MPAPAGRRASIRKKTGIQDLKEVAAQARPRIQVLLPALPLHHLRSTQFQDPEAVSLSPELLEALPYFASAATIPQVAEALNLPISRVTGRRLHILEAL